MRISPGFHARTLTRSMNTSISSDSAVLNSTRHACAGKPGVPPVAQRDDATWPVELPTLSASSCVG
jgi:hypothetical protein